MGKAPFEIFTESWNMLKITRFSGVVGEPGKGAEDLGGALGGENRIGGGESLFVEALTVGLAERDVGRDQ